MTRKPRGPVRITPFKSEHKPEPPFVSASGSAGKPRHRSIGFLYLLPLVGLALILLYAFGAFR